MRRITTGDIMHVHGGFAEGVDYAVRITVRMADPVDGGMLKFALVKTQRRYDYLSVRIRRGPDAYYYEDNLLPVVILNRDERVSLNAPETNYHLWAVCWSGDRIHLDVYHGITDGAGMYEVLSTLLYYYCAKRYGVTDHTGIRTLEKPAGQEELEDPQDVLTGPQDVPAEVQDVPDRPETVSAEESETEAASLPEAFTLETDGGLTPAGPTIWDIELPGDAFLQFTKAHDASPGTMVSVLLARAVDTLYPSREKDIISVYVINARPMLHAEETHHNCLGMAIFDYPDRIRSMPLDRQCTVYRGKTFIQSDPDVLRASMAVNAEALRRAAEGAPTLEEKKTVFGRMFSAGEGHVTYITSYIGKWSRPSVEPYMREIWIHPPNTFSLMAEIGAVNGKLFLSMQQRFHGDSVRNAFLKQMEEHDIPYKLCRIMDNDVARTPEPMDSTQMGSPPPL